MPVMMMSSWCFRRTNARRTAVFVVVVAFFMYCLISSVVEQQETKGKLRMAENELGRLMVENAALTNTTRHQRETDAALRVELELLKDRNAAESDDAARRARETAALLKRLEEENARLGNETRRLEDDLERSLLNSVCHLNPYRDALESGTTSLTEASLSAQGWLRNLSAVREMALEPRFKPRRPDHGRFFPFQVMAPCTDDQISCVGGPCGSDTSKIVCGLSHLEKTNGEGSLQPAATTTTTTTVTSPSPPCVIYSVGGNNQWQFEVHARSLTRCEIHTFDCTGKASRFAVPHDEIENLHFHHVCLGTKHEDAPAVCTGLEKCGETWTLLEIQRRLGHNRIDLFKMDIEGWEWPLLQSWPRLGDPAADQIALPMQVLVEVHYRSQFTELTGITGVPEPWRYDWKYAPDIVDLQEHLIKWDTPSRYGTIIEGARFVPSSL